MSKNYNLIEPEARIVSVDKLSRVMNGNSHLYSHAIIAPAGKIKLALGEYENTGGSFCPSTVIRNMVAKKCIRHNERLKDYAKQLEMQYGEKELPLGIVSKDSFMTYKNNKLENVFDPDKEDLTWAFNIPGNSHFLQIGSIPKRIHIFGSLNKRTIEAFLAEGALNGFYPSQSELMSKYCVNN